MLSVEEAYRDHARLVFKYLMSLTGDEDLSEELVQETFYQAVKSSGRFDGSCRVSTWLCGIAKNKWREYVRKHPPAAPLEEESALTESVEEEALSRMGRVEILRAMHLLPEPAREVMHLRLFGDLSFKEIGDVFEKSEEWARVTYYRAKVRLRKELSPDE